MKEPGGKKRNCLRSARARPLLNHYTFGPAHTGGEGKACKGEGTRHASAVAKGWKGKTQKCARRICTEEIGTGNSGERTNALSAKSGGICEDGAYIVLVFKGDNGGGDTNVFLFLEGK